MNNMCIIVYKPAGQDLPSEDILRTCFANNPDGAGFMYPIHAKEKVRVNKGFMNFADFLAAVQKIADLKSIPLVMHFRIGTQGPNDASNTHPFPITSDEPTLASRQSLADVAMVHNGIISLTSSGWGSHAEKRSDTFIFVRDYASLIIKDARYHEDNGTLILLQRLANSKLCIMGADEQVRMIGKFQEHEGCHYSNDSFEERVVVTRGSHWSFAGASAFDDDDDWFEVSGTTPVSHKGKPEVYAAFLPENALVFDSETGEARGPEFTDVYDRLGYLWHYNLADDTVTAGSNNIEIVDVDSWDPIYPSYDDCIWMTIAKDRSHEPQVIKFHTPVQNASVERKQVVEVPKPTAIVKHEAKKHHESKPNHARRGNKRH